MAPKYLGFVFPVVASLTGCALVSGLSNLDVDDGKTDAATGADASSDSATAPDSDIPPPPFDAGEAGCGCGISVPAGFSPILYGNDKENCPNGLTKDSVVQSPLALSGVGACTCTCALGGCTNLSLTLYSAPGCGGSLGGASANGNCQASPSNYQQAVGARVAGNGTNGTATCSANPSFPKASSDKAVLCTPSSCTSLCSPPSEYPVCFVAQGDVACPQTLPKRTLVATSVTDTRVCSGCSCSVTNPGCNVTLQWYGDGQCTTATGNPQSFATGTCAPASATAAYTAKVAPTGGCSVSGGQGSGSTTPVNVRTVCCK